MSEIKNYEHVERTVLKAIQYDASDPNSKEDIKKFISDKTGFGVAYIEIESIKKVSFIIYCDWDTDSEPDIAFVCDKDYICINELNNVYYMSKEEFEKRFKEIPKES